jgi:uncharacterized protein (TIGR02271 family)
MLGRSPDKTAPASEGRTAPEKADVQEEPSSAKALPLEAVVDPHGGGWSVRLPVRAEEVTVSKESVLLEEVRVLRAVRQETETVRATVQSERLKVDDDTTRRGAGA